MYLPQQCLPAGQGCTFPNNVFLLASGVPSPTTSSCRPVVPVDGRKKSRGVPSPTTSSCWPVVYLLQQCLPAGQWCTFPNNVFLLASGVPSPTMSSCWPVCTFPNNVFLLASGVPPPTTSSCWPVVYLPQKRLPAGQWCTFPNNVFLQASDVPSPTTSSCWPVVFLPQQRLPAGQWCSFPNKVFLQASGVPSPTTLFLAYRKTLGKVHHCRPVVFLPQQRLPAGQWCTFPNNVFLQDVHHWPAGRRCTPLACRKTLLGCTFPNNVHFPSCRPGVYLPQQHLPAGQWCTFPNNVFLLASGVPSPTPQRLPWHHWASGVPSPTTSSCRPVVYLPQQSLHWPAGPVVFRCSPTKSSCWPVAFLPQQRLPAGQWCTFPNNVFLQEDVMQVHHWPVPSPTTSSCRPLLGCTFPNVFLLASGVPSPTTSSCRPVVFLPQQRLPAGQWCQWMAVFGKHRLSCSLDF